MLTRAYIESIDLAAAKLQVRIPLLDGTSYTNRSKTKSDLAWASIAYIPGLQLDYKVGDVVLVGFEDEDFSNPVVLSFLMLNSSGKQISGRLSADLLDLKVKNTFNSENAAIIL